MRWWQACLLGALSALMTLISMKALLRYIEATQAGSIVVDAAALDAEAVAPDAAEGGARVCDEPMVAEVETAGSFTRDTGFRSRMPHSPSLVAPGTDSVSIGWPYLAAEFSIADLCSAEEVSPSYIRLVCLGSSGDMRTIEYCMDSTDAIANFVNGRPWGGRSPRPEKCMPRETESTCARLETKIPKRDLTPLAKAYLDDNPSERCASSKAPRRKVAATLVRHRYPNSFWKGPNCSTAPCCFDFTGVRLAIPLAGVGPSQDLGMLSQQCLGPCNGSQSRTPNGFSVHCFEGDSVHAYQLGDALYIAEDDHVRRVPLPCGVELDFQLKGFMANLTPGSISLDD